MTEIDTSAAAVERLALSLQIADQPITAATLRALVAERDAALSKVQDAALSEGAITEIRALLARHDVPVAAFVDDHVGNAIAQRDEARADRDRLAARVAELEGALGELRALACRPAGGWLDGQHAMHLDKIAALAGSTADDR